MRIQEAKDEIDTLVSAFLNTSDEAAADHLLEQLICRHLIPVISNIIKSTVKPYNMPFGNNAALLDMDDISSDVVTRLLKSLRKLKASAGDGTFNEFQQGGFRNYVAVTTYNTCYDYLRNKYPARHRLKKRLRYVLSHHRELALWDNGEESLCGMADWAGQTSSHVSAERLQDFHSNLQNFKQSLQPHQDDRPESLVQTLRAIFTRLDSPIGLDDLVNVVAELLGVRGQVFAPAENLEDAAGLDLRAYEAESRLSTRLEQRIYLEQLWEEIIKLPLGQRTALLLSLKDSQGDELVTLLDHLRIATLPQIAEALAMSAERFTDLWKSSPIDDLTIAKHLGVMRQQVINLRLSARRRLARRMEAKARRAAPGPSTRFARARTQT